MGLPEEPALVWFLPAWCRTIGKHSWRDTQGTQRYTFTQCVQVLHTNQASAVLIVFPALEISMLPVFIVMAKP